MTNYLIGEMQKQLISVQNTLKWLTIGKVTESEESVADPQQGLFLKSWDFGTKLDKPEGKGAPQ